jgi:NAD(P)-dependent dehydrogenase (short-subunit alcohol dehydrogenase family)
MSAEIASVRQLSSSSISFSLKLKDPDGMHYLPGQYDDAGALVLLLVDAARRRRSVPGAQHPRRIDVVLPGGAGQGRSCGHSSRPKGAVNGLTSALGFELGTKNISVNAVAPGGTTAPPRAVSRNAAVPNGEEKAWIEEVIAQTIESSPMKRYGLLRSMSAAILSLASDAASYITGTVRPVGGGHQG